MKAVLVSCWIVACIAGCNAGNPIATEEYSAFISRSGASYAAERNSGEVSIWFSPQEYGSELQGLSIQNIRSPEGSEVSISNPSSAKGEQWIILTVRNVNTAKADWHIAWNVYEGTDRRQTIRVVMTPPPNVKVTIDGQEIPVSKASGQ